MLSFLDKIASGREYDADAYAECLRTSVSEIVRHQIEVGLDVIDDGEIGKASWITYLYERVSGLEMRSVEREGSVLPPSRDRQAFPGAYAALDALRRRGGNCWTATWRRIRMRDERARSHGGDLGLHRTDDVC